MSHRLELESTFRRIYILVTFCFFFCFLIPFFFLFRRALRNHIVNFSTTVTYFSLSSSLSLSFLLPSSPVSLHLRTSSTLCRVAFDTRACNVESIRCDAFGTHTRSLLSCLHSLFSTCHCHRHVRLRKRQRAESFQLAETRANLP